METVHFITVSPGEKDLLRRIKKEYYELIKSPTSESGEANLIQIFEWAKQKGYKYITTYYDENSDYKNKNVLVFEKTFDIPKVHKKDSYE